jgi:hypothetical protein
MIRKVIVWNMMTLDGYFEGPKPWEIDWHEYVWGEELERFSLNQAQEVGTLLFGRKTYEGMAGYSRAHFWGGLANKTGVLDNNACRILRAYARIVGDWAMWFRSGCPGHSQPELRYILHRLRCAWVYFEKPVTTVKQV